MMVPISSKFIAIAIGYLIAGAQCFSSPSSYYFAHQCQRITTSSSCPNSNNNARNNNNAVFSLHVINTETTQDEKVDAPASMLYYDDIEDPDNPLGVVCARGVCVIPDDVEIDWSAPPGTIPREQSLVDKFLTSYLGPRLMLAFASILYGANFPLGVVMNDALVPSAATSARMLFAALALSPFLFKLETKLAGRALVGGCFVALGYITQSLSLVDTSPAKVAFIGAATVIVCPVLEALLNKKDMSIKNQPQVWLAATLCLTGVGILELYDPTGQTTIADAFSQIGTGDFLALGQAVGFGTSFVLTEGMMREEPSQALPITACQVSTTAFICMVWCLVDGWVGTADAESYNVPAMFFDPTLRMAALSVLFTGLVTTALNRFIETTALGKLKSAEASVILATEPLWAALFAALWLKDDFGANDYIGGALIVAACLATALKKEDFKFMDDFFDDGNEGTNGGAERIEGSFE